MSSGTRGEWWKTRSRVKNSGTRGERKNNRIDGEE